MKRGRTFYTALVSGVVALVLLLVSVNLPAQLVFETKPYALVVLKSGNLDGWSAKELGLTSAQFDLVKNNYAEFLRRHKTADDSDSSDSSDSSDDNDSSDEDDDNGGPHKIVHVKQMTDADKVSYQSNTHNDKEKNDTDDDHHNYHGDDGDNNEDDDHDDGDNDDDHDNHHGDDEDNDDDDDDHIDGDEDDDDGNRRKKREDHDDSDDNDDGDREDDDDGSKKANVSDESTWSSSEEGDGNGDSSSSEILPLEQRLKDKPVTQTVSIGLFHGKICSVMKNAKERCRTVSTNEAIFIMKKEVSFMENDINMPVWNNLRVESIFAVSACVLGMFFLIASLKPCCDNKRLPVYLGSVSFFASGVLVFIPIVRILLVSTDFEQNLATDLNVTTKLLTSWSLVFYGIGAPFALLASFSLVATKWFKATKKWYHLLKMSPQVPEFVPNGKAVEIKMTDVEAKETQAQGDTRTNIYSKVEDKLDLLDGIDKEKGSLNKL